MVTDDSPSRERIPMPNSKKVDALNEIKRIKDLRHRMPLGPNSLPSICCYTFYNTYDTMTNMKLSPDSSLLSCGYADSYLEVCTMSPKNKLKSLISSMEIGKFNLSDGGKCVVVSFDVVA